MKKKILALILCVFMLFATSCTLNEKEADTQQTETTAVEKTVENGNVRGKVLSGTGDMLIAGIIIVDEENNSYRVTTNAYGGYHLKLQPGKYTLTFTRGFEYDTYTTTITVESLKTYYLRDVRLNQLVDTYATGWVAGELHEHTSYSDGSDTISDLAIADASSNLYWGFLTDHNTSRGVPEWRETSNIRVSTDENGVDRFFSAFAGSEITTEFGHFNSLGTGMTFDKYEINFTEAERASSSSKTFARNKMVYLAQQINRQGYLAQMNHPYSITNMGAMNYVSETDFELLECFDTMEIWNAYFVVPDGRFTVKNSDNQNYKAKLLWYSTLNRVKDGGKFITATAGTDNHDSTGYASAQVRSSFADSYSNISDYQNYCRYGGKYAGCIVTYAYLNGAEVTQENVLAAIGAGHSYLSNGPILDCKVGDKVFGETVSANEGKITFTNNLFCRDGMSTIRYVVNGETVKEIALNDATSYTESVELTGLNTGDWVLVEVLGDWGVYAISNPFFIG